MKLGFPSGSRPAIKIKYYRTHKYFSRETEKIKLEENYKFSSHTKKRLYIPASEHLETLPLGYNFFLQNPVHNNTSKSLH